MTTIPRTLVLSNNNGLDPCAFIPSGWEVFMEPCKTPANDLMVSSWTKEAKLAFDKCVTNAYEICLATFSNPDLDRASPENQINVKKVNCNMITYNTCKEEMETFFRSIWSDWDNPYPTKMILLATGAAILGASYIMYQKCKNTRNPE